MNTVSSVNAVFIFRLLLCAMWVLCGQEQIGRAVRTEEAVLLEARRLRRLCEVTAAYGFPGGACAERCSREGPGHVTKPGQLRHCVEGGWGTG